jgi:hypothetical protein
VARRVEVYHLRLRPGAKLLGNGLMLDIVVKWWPVMDTAEAAMMFLARWNAAAAPAAGRPPRVFSAGGKCNARPIPLPSRSGIPSNGPPVPEAKHETHSH